MLCISVRAVFVCVLFIPPVGCLEVVLQATETCSSSNEFDPTLTTMTKLSAGAILTKLSAVFPATLCRTSNLLWGQPRGPGLRGAQKSLLSSFSVQLGKASLSNSPDFWPTAVSLAGSADDSASYVGLSSRTGPRVPCRCACGLTQPRLAHLAFGCAGR